MECVHLDYVLKTKRSEIKDHLHDVPRQEVKTAVLESNLKFLGGVSHSLPYAAMVPGQAFEWGPRRDELRIRVLLPRYPYILEPACIILSQIRDWGFWGAVAAPWSHPFIKSLIISQPSFASIRIPPRSVVVRVGSAPSSQIHAIGPHQKYLQNHHGWVVY